MLSVLLLDESYYGVYKRDLDDEGESHRRPRKQGKYFSIIKIHIQIYGYCE